jgi:heme/copper-type cytochrome/quinol oxidase subunit 1
LPHYPGGILRWLTTTNHKDIGTMYLTVRTDHVLRRRRDDPRRPGMELFQPGLQVMQPELFNQLIGVHALVMIFAALMPAATGFANWQIPADDRRAGHGTAAHQQLGFLAAAASGDAADAAVHPGAVRYR